MATDHLTILFILLMHNWSGEDSKNRDRETEWNCLDTIRLASITAPLGLDTFASITVMEMSCYSAIIWCKRTNITSIVLKRMKN